MIKPGPIKRSTALIPFSKDHHFALLLIWKIRQGLRFDIETLRMGTYINFFFENNLKEHFKEEEELLFTQLDENDDLRLSAEKDHAMLSLLNENIKLQPTIANIKEFADKLEEHIRFEERLLFAHLQSILQRSQLNSIREKMAKHIQKEDDWKDIFWMKPGK